MSITDGTKTNHELYIWTQTTKCPAVLEDSPSNSDQIHIWSAGKLIKNVALTQTKTPQWTFSKRYYRCNIHGLILCLSTTQSKHCLIAPAWPVRIMPLFFCWAEGVNCVVRGSLTFVHPPASLCIRPNRRDCCMAAILCPSAPTLLQRPGWRNVCHGSCLPFVCAHCLAHWSDPTAGKWTWWWGKVNFCKDLLHTLSTQHTLNSICEHITYPTVLCHICERRTHSSCKEFFPCLWFCH